MSADRTLIYVFGEKTISEDSKLSVETTSWYGGSVLLTETTVRRYRPDGDADVVRDVRSESQATRGRATRRAIAIHDGLVRVELMRKASSEQEVENRDS